MLGLRSKTLLTNITIFNCLQVPGVLTGGSNYDDDDVSFLSNWQQVQFPFCSSWWCTSHRYEWAYYTQCSK